MRDALLSNIADAMAEDKDIFFVSADFGSPMLDRIRTQYSDRFANVGVAEQNLINISSGLAIEGYKVFAYAIAPFITMRCYEQIRVNLALLSVVRPLNVNLIGVGVGYSYVVSGPTHQCYEDLSIMRAMPNVSIYSPADHVTTGAMLSECLSQGGPKYIRLDAQPQPVLYEDRMPNIARGFESLREGRDVCIVATGYMVHTALNVAERLAKSGVEVGVIDLFKITGFSEKALADALSPHRCIVTLEEGFRGKGGLDAMIFDFATRHAIKAPILNIGVEGMYRFELGSRIELHEHVGIGTAAVSEKISTFMAKTAG